MWLSLTHSSGEKFLLNMDWVLRIESKDIGTEVLFPGIEFTVRETPKEIASMIGVAVDYKTAKYEKALKEIVAACRSSESGPAWVSLGIASKAMDGN